MVDNQPAINPGGGAPESAKQSCSGVQGGTNLYKILKQLQQPNQPNNTKYIF